MRADDEEEQHIQKLREMDIEEKKENEEIFEEGEGSIFERC